jgi:galactokinase
VPIEVIQENKDAFSSIAHFKRARHASTEQSRVIEAVQALKDNDLTGFSTLLTQTHMSLRNDFEVSCEELDVLVDLALNEGALGARMTGAGFGGCIIAILHKNLIDKFTKNITEKYANIIGYEPSCYIANSSDHAHFLGGK